MTGPTKHEDLQWCPPRGRSVPVLECHTNCVDDCQRQICWAGRISQSHVEAQAAQEREAERMELARLRFNNVGGAWSDALRWADRQMDEEGETGG